LICLVVRSNIAEVKAHWDHAIAKFLSAAAHRRIRNHLRHRRQNRFKPGIIARECCAALEKLLARRGHLVAVSHDVRSAMEAAVRNKFDLLISDIALPDGTGMDLMMQLRAIANVPGIAISGFGNNGDIERSLQAGFSEHLIKPIKLDNLEAAIERALSAT
jgi:CheY-like chemotaxis protein